MKKQLYGKVLYSWLILLGIAFLAVSLRFRETLSLLQIDLRYRFADNLAFVKHMVLWFGFFSVFCLTVFLCVAVTKSICWELGFKKKTICLKIEDGSLNKCFFKIVLVGLCILICMTAAYVYLNRASFRKGTTFSQNQDVLILHAGGGIDDYSYTNCAEAFENSCLKNAKMIELDFLMTSDDELVCWHDWSSPMNDSVPAGEVLSADVFLSQKIHNQFTPMSLESVIDFMKRYPDIYIVTDTKYSYPEQVKKQFRKLLETVKKLNADEILDRLIIQIYKHEMYRTVDEIYHFKNYILTLYLIEGQSGNEFLQHCRFCKRNGIKIITMWDYWASPDNIQTANRYGLDIYVHTVNDLGEIKELQQMGVKGFYTDFIFPDMLH